MEAYRGANNKRPRASKKWHWKLQEDELLTQLVKTHGPRNWNYIAQLISGRTGVSCRLRWINHLNPKVDKTPFSEKEQERLVELHRDYGNKWATIAKFFPGRTDNQLKSRYHTLVGSRNMKREGCLNIGSVDVSSYGSLSEVDVGPQSSHAPCSTDIKTMMPSSINTRHETLFGPLYSFESTRLGNIDANMRRTSCGYHMMSAVARPQQGVRVKNYQFIDFLGVGNSE